MKRAFLSVVCLSIILFGLSSEVEARWVQTTGPTGGYVGYLATIGSDVYAAVPWGGVYRSVDNGASWTPVNLAPNSTRSVVFFYVLDSKFFVSTVNQELFMSADLGENWTLVDPPSDYCSMNPKVARGSDIFATGCTWRVYISNDDLVTWKPINKGLTYSDLTSMAVSDGIVFSGNRDGDIYRFSDGDSTWTKVFTSTTGQNITAVVTNEGKIFAAIDGSGVIVSSDQGDNWTAINSGLPNLNLHHLKVIDSRVYAPTLAGLYRLDDDGMSWTSLGLDGHVVTAFEISGPNFIASTQEVGVLISSDGGANWTVSNSGIVSSVVNDIVSKGERIVAATNQGLQLSRDGGDNWEGIAPVGVQFRCMEACGSYICASTPSAFYRSDDDGETWNLLSSVSGFTDMEASGDKLVGANVNGVFLSSDFGETWITTSITRNIFGVGYFGSSILASASDSIYVSHNNGATWTHSSLNPTYVGLTWSFAPCGADFFAATTGDGVYISRDSGLTWSPVHGGSRSPVDLTGKWIMPMFTRGTTLYAGCEFGLFSTVDQGETWLPVGSGLPAYISAIECSENEMLAGVDNRGVWKLSLGDCCSGIVGDANYNGGYEPTIGDVSTLIDMLFISRNPVECLAEADVNQSGNTTPTINDITIGDVSTLIDHLFISGTPLAECP
jgi:photosystem II stability/assembly factor-like uncharacterized protein